MNSVYTQEEVIANFQALIESWNFNTELRRLGIGALQLMRRKQMLLEFQGLFAGLWRLALTRSFPEDGEQIFEGYLARCLTDLPNTKKALQRVERSRQYAEMLALRGDTNFSEVSRHLASFLDLPEAAHHRASLQLALHIRQMYNRIFELMV